MEEASVCGNVTIYGGKVLNSTCLFALVMILLVCVLKYLKEAIYLRRDSSETKRKI